MEGIIDLHHHLIHGMDDGPATPEESLRMLQQAEASGVAVAAVTPHACPVRTPFDHETYRRRLQELQTIAAENGLRIRLVCGTEVLYGSMASKLLRRGALFPLGDSWHVLVEFHPHEHFGAICRAAVHLSNAGYSMVLAHAERCRCLRWGHRLRRLRQECHVTVQVNAGTVLGRSGLFARWLSHLWIRRGLVDLIASDAHNLSDRPCLMGPCADLVSRRFGPETAQRLFISNARAILGEKDRINTVKEQEPQLTRAFHS